MLVLAWKLRWVLTTLLLTAVSMITAPFASAQGAGAKVDDAPIPPGIDIFNLNLGQTRAFSRSKNFELVGHSYFKGPWLTPFARQNGLGAGFNTARVHTSRPSTRPRARRRIGRSARPTRIGTPA